MISHSLSAWATSFGSEPRTLERQLVKAGFSFKPREKIPASAIKTAIIGEKAAAETRLKEAQAADQERKNKIADGEMIPLEDVLTLQRKTLLPIRQWMLALAGSIGHLCNPTDPKHAQDQITRAVNSALPMLREEIGKVDK